MRMCMHTGEYMHDIYVYIFNKVAKIVCDLARAVPERVCESVHRELKCAYTQRSLCMNQSCAHGVSFGIIYRYMYRYMLHVNPPEFLEDCFKVVSGTIQCQFAEVHLYICAYKYYVYTHTYTFNRSQYISLPGNQCFSMY